jgi:hypothetical protein
MRRFRTFFLLDEKLRRDDDCSGSSAHAERSLRRGFSLSGDTGGDGSGAPGCGPCSLPDPRPEGRQGPANGRFEERLNEAIDG